MNTEGFRRDTDFAWVIFWAVFGVSLGLRLVLLGQHAFHMDEALYAGWSRRILHGDLLLTGGFNNDKPPLQPYLGALGLALFGENESAIRLMDAILSSLECGLLGWALVPLAGPLAALGAGLLLASSPLHRAYGASGIMDGPLSLLLLGSFILASKDRPAASGLAWGLACWAKQTALFLVPLPLVVVLVMAPMPWPAVKSWVQGALLAWVPLLIWSALFAHPHLGAFWCMAAHQPEVGLHLGGAMERFRMWLQLSGGDLPWANAVPWMGAAGSLLGIYLFLKAPVAQLRAWGLALLLPLHAVMVFSLLNMRLFDRYPLPYAWALCAVPAIAVAAWPRKTWGRRIFTVLCLGLGLAALIAARSQVFPPDNQGSAGSANDEYRAALLDLKRREPGPATLVSAAGGLRWMGGWYLGSAWSLVEEPEALPDGGRPLYALEWESTPPPPQRHWIVIRKFESLGTAPAWILYRAAS